MNISELEEKLTAYGAGGHYLFEVFVIQLLRIEIESQGKELKYMDHGTRVPFDAVAPQGIGKIPGPLLIEIKSSVTKKSMEELINVFKNYSISDNFALLIISLRRTALNKNYFDGWADLIKGGLYLWDCEEVQSLIDKHKIQARDISAKLFSLRLQNTIESDQAPWKDRRNEIMREIGAAYNAGRFSLMLGAGVSSSAGLPDWNTLLNSLFVSMLTGTDEEKSKADHEHISSIVRRLRQVDGPSTLTLARYVRKGMAKGSTVEQSEFINSVTHSLYGLRDGRRSISSPLIKGIVDLCAPSRMGAKVAAILTYNFDDLIERELLARDLVHKSIFEDVDLARPEELPVYHVHGFLPENRSRYPNIDKGTLVFSEEGYHQIYRDAYHWSNLVQLSSLRETCCLMIGLSLTDPNLRRLLEISVKSNDKPKHFAFLKRLSFEEFMKVDGKNVVSASKAMVEKFLERHHKLNEQVLIELGVNLVWYEHHEEIPLLLKEIIKNQRASTL